MWIADQWKDYELLDTANGEKLERWGAYRLIRPDPQVIWREPSSPALWKEAHARYHRSASGGGHWEQLQKLPDQWTVSYRDLTFAVRPMGFKHTGLFPEQAVNWDFMAERLQDRGRGKGAAVLNLFAYTGGATVAAAAGGAAEVVHVDAAKGIIALAKENVALSGQQAALVRFMVDDALKFVAREGRRGRRYDGMVMDPPSYGRGPNGEVWKIEDELYGLIAASMEIMSASPLFFILNSYTTGLSPTVLGNLFELTLKKRFGGMVTADEIGLRATSSGLVLPCGCTCRWEA